MKHAARRAAREFHISRVSRKQAIEVSPLKREREREDSKYTKLTSQLRSLCVCVPEHRSEEHTHITYVYRDV